MFSAMFAAPRLCLLGLDFDEHILCITPIGDRIRIGIIYCWIPREVRRVASREDVVGHERGDWHLLRSELDELLAQIDGLRVVEGEFLDGFNDLVELGILPAHIVATCGLSAARFVEL